MYSALWRALPGPAWLRLILLLAAVAMVVYALFYYAFPVIYNMLPQPDSTIE